MNQKELITNERGPYGSRWQSVRDDDEKDRIAQEQGDLEGYSLSAVWWQVEIQRCPSPSGIHWATGG